MRNPDDKTTTTVKSVHLPLIPGRRDGEGEKVPGGDEERCTFMKAESDREAEWKSCASFCRSNQSLSSLPLERREKPSEAFPLSSSDFTETPSWEDPLILHTVWDLLREERQVNFPLSPSGFECVFLVTVLVREFDASNVCSLNRILQLCVWVTHLLLLLSVSCSNLDSVSHFRESVFFSPWRLSCHSFSQEDKTILPVLLAKRRRGFPLVTYQESIIITCLVFSFLTFCCFSHLSISTDFLYLVLTWKEGDIKDPKQQANTTTTHFSISEICNLPSSFLRSSNHKRFFQFPIPAFCHLQHFTHVCYMSCKMLGFRLLLQQQSHLLHHL